MIFSPKPYKNRFHKQVLPPSFRKKSRKWSKLSNCWPASPTTYVLLPPWPTWSWSRVCSCYRTSRGRTWSRSNCSWPTLWKTPPRTSCTKSLWFRTSWTSLSSWSRKTTRWTWCWRTSTWSTSSRTWSCSYRPRSINGRSSWWVWSPASPVERDSTAPPASTRRAFWSTIVVRNWSRSWSTCWATP